MTSFLTIPQSQDATNSGKHCQLFGNAIGKRMPILYGGSVNIENAPHFVRKLDIDGLFIGRAAWDVDSFIQIIEVIQKKVQVPEI